jgi:flagellar protein FlaF
MYQFSYAEVLEESPAVARQHERRAIEHSIALLEKADKAGTDSFEAIEALSFLRRLWTILIEDLAKSENELPETLRADLISIGIWIMRESDQIRLSKSANFRGLIEVSSIICDGLK